MQIPSKLNILGITYQIKFVDDLKTAIAPYLTHEEKEDDTQEYFG